MNHSIGGEFGLSPQMFLKDIVNQDIRPYPRKYQLLLDTGRSALLLALSAIIAQGGKRQAWLPYYCCDSVLLPFKQLEFQLHFYSMGFDLQHPDRLPGALNGQTFLFINYFGRKNTAVINWLNQQDHNFYIIEDNVQASLNGNVGITGDYVINSYRKFLPQPDGAVLAYDKAMDWEASPPDEEFISRKLIAKLIREEQGNPAEFLKLFHDSESGIDQVIQPRLVSFLSRYLLTRTDLNEISAIRRSNFQYLLGLIKSRPSVQKLLSPLYDSLADGEVPLGLPVRVDPRIRDRLREHLLQYQIFCPVHWNITGSDTAGLFAEDYRLSRSILTLPIDQRLDKSAVDFLFSRLADFFSES